MAFITKLKCSNGMLLKENADSFPWQQRVGGIYCYDNDKDSSELNLVEFEKSIVENTKS